MSLLLIVKMKRQTDLAIVIIVCHVVSYAYAEWLFGKTRSYYLFVAHSRILTCEFLTSLVCTIVGLLNGGSPVAVSLALLGTNYAFSKIGVDSVSGNAGVSFHFDD